MDSFFKRIIRKGHEEYRIEIGFDDNAIMDNSAKFEIEAERRTLPDGNFEKVILEIDVQFERNQIVISNKAPQKVLATLSLDTYLEEPGDFEGNGIDLDDEEKHIFDSFSDEAGEPLEAGIAETMIGSIPTDPFLGCLIKGAVSTLVGQIIRCWNNMRLRSALSSFREKARDIYGCLREYAPRMLFTFMYRSGKCVVTCGLS